MKVILIQDVPNVGKAWEVHNVAEGYARNFLFPRKLAIEANEANMRDLNKRAAAARAKEAKTEAEAREVADRINGVTLQIPGKVAEGSTKLYGSITPGDIAEELEKKHKVVVDKRKIDLAEPVKSLGEYDVPIHLHRNVTAHLKLEVVEG